MTLVPSPPPGPHSAPSMPVGVAGSGAAGSLRDGSKRGARTLEDCINIRTLRHDCSWIVLSGSVLREKKSYVRLRFQSGARLGRCPQLEVEHSISGGVSDHLRRYASHNFMTSRQPVNDVE